MMTIAEQMDYITSRGGKRDPQELRRQQIRRAKAQKVKLDPVVQEWMDQEVQWQEDWQRSHSGEEEW